MIYLLSVLGPSTSRSAQRYNRVFERAQTILNRTFGLELVELQSRAALDKAAAAADPLNDDDDNDDEAPAATQGKGKKKAAGKKRGEPILPRDSSF